MNSPIHLDPEQFHTELDAFNRTVSEGERQQLQRLHAGLEAHDAARTRDQFELLLQWNAFSGLLAKWKAARIADSKLNLAVDTWFLLDTIRALTPGTDEELHYVTGPLVGNTRVLSRLCALKLEKQSAVYAKATAQSCADSLIEMNEHGNLLLAVAHSHPGYGAAATQESSIDTNYLGRIQRHGSDAIGVIVTRDGFVRFFTVHRPFRVHVVGNGINQVEENVWQVESLRTGRRPKG